MNIAVVDDQKEFSEIIRDKLENLKVCYIDIYIFASIKDMEKTNLLFGLILLDIDMPDIDGIEYSKLHKEQKIVFITGLGNRIKEAFGSNVYGFIEKSCLDEEFDNTINNVLDELSKQTFVSLRTEGGVQDFLLDDIVYIQYLTNRNIAFVYRGQNYIIKGYTLKKLENVLTKQFEYTDRNTIINLKRVTGSVNRRIMLDGVSQLFEVSRRRIAVFDKIGDRKDK